MQATIKNASWYTSYLQHFKDKDTKSSKLNVTFVDLSKGRVHLKVYSMGRYNFQVCVFESLIIIDR